MPAKTYHRTADGQMVDETTAFDGAGVLRSGFTMRTKMQMMDSANIATLRRPGSIAMADAEQDERSARIDAFNAKLSDAWRNPPAAAPTHEAATLDVYDSYDRRMSEAWRHI